MEAAQSRTRILPSRRAKRPRTHTASCSFCAQRSGARINHAPVSARAPIAQYEDGDPDLARVTCKTAWADLGDGPAGLIAERVLIYDVADYIRFRAVCRSWRRCSRDPRCSAGGLDRRFHLWRWTMLHEKLAEPRRRFLNTSTAEFVLVDIPELHDHEVVAVTPEGLLVLLIYKPQHATVRLLNPLTRHLVELPPLTTLLECDSAYHEAWGSGIASDDSTIVLCFHRLQVLGITKPGDDRRTLLKYQGNGIIGSPLMLAGRFYCFSCSKGVMVLEIGPDQTPRLEVAAKLNIRVSSYCHTVHLVNNFGDLMLVHRRRVKPPKWICRYDLYKVDLDTGTLISVKSLGGTGRAVFMGMCCALSASVEVFPAGSICADTIYPSFDFSERSRFEVGSYHLRDGSIKRPKRLRGGLVPRPHTLIDCLSLSNDDE